MSVRKRAVRRRDLELARAEARSSSGPAEGSEPLKRDDFSSNRHPALAFWWSMIFSENRCPLFGIMLQLVQLEAGRLDDGGPFGGFAAPEIGHLFGRALQRLRAGVDEFLPHGLV